MVEASDFDQVLDRDLRNHRAGTGDPKKRLNAKENQKRESQMKKRDNQRNGGDGVNDAEELKQEFDEINKDYLKKVERQKKLEEEVKKAEEKKQEFEKDFISLAIGPEPKDTNKKKAYDEKIQGLTSPKAKVQNHANGIQRAALLDYLKKSLN